jgi:hypothetical protein
VEQNKGLWRGFFDKVRTDNNFRTSVLMTGLGMMRSQRPGENAGDVIGQSLQTGVQTLDTLRQRQRTQEIDDAERKRKAGLDERQTVVGERGATSQEKQVDIAGKRAETEASDVKSRWDNAQAALNEAIRHNKATEVIDRLRAVADKIRAEAYGSFRKNMPGFQVKAMDAISEQLQAQGYDQVTADAMAAARVQTTGKATNPGDRVREMFTEKLKQYGGSLEALDHPMTADMQKQWMEEAIDLDKRLEMIANPQAIVPPGPNPTPKRPGQEASGPGTAAGAGAPASPPGPQAAVVPAVTPPAAVPPGGPPSAPPDVKAQVQAALARGVPIEQIRQRLIQQGINPAAAGL